jgi:hypothetical protein
MVNTKTENMINLEAILEPVKESKQFSTYLLVYESNHPLLLI